MPSPEIAGAPSGPADKPTEKIFTVGTLRYTKQQLFILFVWLMWNDFSFTLIERVNSLTNFLMKDTGATYTELAGIATIGTFVSISINPVFSVWSDRLRTKWGRRRPFLFIVTPFFAFFLMTIPFMPDFYHYLMRFPLANRLLSDIPMNGPILFIATASVLMGIFNAMFLTIFGYLYYDVVPLEVMARFSSIGKIIASLAVFIWSFYLFGLGEHHMKAIYVGVSSFCLVIYLVSVWKVKEGDYPPPDVHKKGGVVAPIRAYLVECFSQPYFLWIFGGFTLIQLGNAGNNYQTYYLHYDLKMSLDVMGKMQAIPQVLVMALGFAIGSLADRLKPVRLMAPMYFFYGLTNFGSYFFVHDQWSYLFWVTLSNLALFGVAVIHSAFTVEMYPREKIGQFCSASATTQAVICGAAATFVGMLFDHIQYNRFGYLWAALFEFLGAIVFVKVYLDWVKRKGQVPVPHSG